MQGRLGKRCFCLSVRPSVAYIANNSRTQRPSVPKFGRKVPTLDATQFQGQKVKSQGHFHIFRMARPTNFKLGVRMEDDDPHQSQVPWPPRSKVRVISSRLISASFSFGKQNAVPVSLEAGGGIPCRPNPAARLVVYCNLFTYLMIYCTCIVWDTICHVNPS